MSQAMLRMAGRATGGHNGLHLRLHARISREKLREMFGCPVMTC